MKTINLCITSFCTAILIIVQKPVYSQPNLSNYYASSSNYSWSYFPFPVVSKDFTYEERQLIWRSLAKAKDLMFNDLVGECIQKYTTFGYKGKSPTGGVRSFAMLASAHPKLRPGQGRQVSSNYRSGLQYLYVNKMYEQNSVLGRAPLDIGVGERDLEIALNTHNLSKYSSQTFWAGVIVHEVLHNWGYTHPEVQNGDFSKIPGNFVYETGWCLNREGSIKQPGSFNLDGGVGSPDGGGPFVD
jgi:hypothetical protein